MPVSALVVHDQVQGLLARDLTIDASQKVEKLLMTMALVKVTYDSSLQQVQRSE